MNRTNHEGRHRHQPLPADAPAAKAWCYRAHVPTRHIAWLVMMVEASEGLAIVRTRAAAAGLVEFWVTDSAAADLEAFMAACGLELELQVEPRLPLDAGVITEAAAQVYR